MKNGAGAFYSQKYEKTANGTPHTWSDIVSPLKAINANLKVSHFLNGENQHSISKADENQ